MKFYKKNYSPPPKKIKIKQPNEKQKNPFREFLINLISSITKNLKKRCLMKPLLPKPSSTPIYEWQKRSNSHNVISEYNIFMTPRASNPTYLDPKHQDPTPMTSKHQDPIPKTLPISPNTSQNSHFEYLTLQKPMKNALKIPIKEMLKSYSGLNFNEKKSPKGNLKIKELYTDDVSKWFQSLSHRGVENQSAEIKGVSPRKTSPTKHDEENSAGKSNGKGSMDLNFASSTTNKIRKMLMTSPYNNSSKALVNSLKCLKNLSHGNLLSDDLRTSTVQSNFSKPNKGFLSNLNFSRKNLVKMAASATHHINTKGLPEKASSNDRNKGKEAKTAVIIQEESTFKNSNSYKSTHNTSKSADKTKDKQAEELFQLFNRAKCLLYKYKIKEQEWKKEKEELMREIENLKENQKV